MRENKRLYGGLKLICGFFDSIKDDVEQIKNDYLKYAEAVVRAVADYKGIPYTYKSDDIYVVQKGDTLWGISKKFGISVNDLKELNNLSTNVLKIGQTLKVKKEQIDDNEQSINTYTVQKGDSLYAIAKMYDTSVEELKEINNLSTNVLQIGQVLKIPSKYKEYIVKKGDSLWKIAQENNTNVSTLTKINNLKSTTLQIGQKLLIPNL